MLRRIVSLIGLTVLALTVLIQPQTGGVARARNAPNDQFVRRDGNVLRLDGKQFRFAGTNNYYLMYKSRAMVDDVLSAAAANDFAVVRTWGWLDIGNQDGSNSVAGKADNVYFQYWDGTQPAYNDGADGLQRLDYVVAKAKAEGVRLVIPFTNNWRDFGGMDQYVRWRGGQYHDQFYTDPLIRQWYKNWIAHLLNRTNSITGIKYKDEPAIMAWELANEPRCIGSGVYPRSSACTEQTLIAWADEMSTFIKSIDQNHLVSVGDEGFYCVAGSTDWTENCNEGGDTLAFTRLPHIDVMSFHLYPDHWGKDALWGMDWIKRHIRDAKSIGKPVMLGEFGWRDKATRNRVYKKWTDAFFKSGGQSGGDGALYWILSGKQDDGSLYGDYDGFTVYASDPVFITLGNFAQIMNANRSMVFPPVADHDAATTEFETPATLSPADNDVAYGGATLPVSTIDLDPAAAGRQTSRSTSGGTFTLDPRGTVLFTPNAGFAGRATISYTITDSSARHSNVANLVVSVKPDPNGALVLFSFESGTEGWGPASWEIGKGTAAQSAAYQTKDSYSLEMTVVSEGWFGVTFAPPADLSGKTRLKFDIKAGGAGTSTDLALQTGDSYTWTQYVGTWVESGSATTIDIDLLSQNAEFNKVQALYLYLKPGTHYIDFVRVE